MRYKEIYKYEQYKRRLRVITKKTLELSKGAWKDRALDGLPMIHALATHL